MLREYSLQLYELHQTQIDLKQNSTMQILTIVTVMFAPLTLVTGWFGMNLTVLPGLDWPYMAGHDLHPSPGHDRGDGAVLQAEEMALGDFGSP